MNKEEFLAKHTFSEAGLPTARRVFETLTQDGAHASHRTAKALGLLIQALNESGHLTPEQIDHLLLEVI